MDAWIVAVGAASSVPAETLIVCEETVSSAGGGGSPPLLPPLPFPPHAPSKKNAPQPVHLSIRADIPISVIVIRVAVCQKNEICTLYCSKLTSKGESPQPQRAGASPDYASC